MKNFYVFWALLAVDIAVVGVIVWLAWKERKERARG
jgi:cbb3-type cytochrome oxidase subunit 3